MSGEPDNLVLVYLRRMDAKLDQMIEVVQDHGRRLTALETALGKFVALEMRHYPRLALHADRMEERLGRIERRLDLQEA